MARRRIAFALSYRGAALRRAWWRRFPERGFFTSSLCCIFALLAQVSCSSRTSTHSDAPTPLDADAQSPASRPYVVVSLEPWSFGASRGVTIRTPSYRLFTTLDDEVLRERLPVFLEAAGAQYRGAITPLSPPPFALDTYVMSNRAQWQSIVTQLLGSHSDLVASMNRGGFTLQGRSILYELGPRDTLVLLAHEGWHQFAQASFKEPLPIWLDEGLATWFEGHRWIATTPLFTPRDNPDRMQSLRKASRADSLIPLDQLVNTLPQDWIAMGGDWPLTYYAQVWAMTRFLAENPQRREALANILTLASRGRLRSELSRRLGDRAAGIAMSRRVGPAVLESFVNRDQDTLQREFSEFVRAITSAAPVPTPTGTRSQARDDSPP